MWTPPTLPANAVRAELHLSGPAKSAKFLHDLIIEIETPFDSHEEMDGYVFVYTSQEMAQRVFKQLHNELYHRHPELIGHPDDVTIEDDVLCFLGCEVFVRQ